MCMHAHAHTECKRTYPQKKLYIGVHLIAVTTRSNIQMLYETSFVFTITNMAKIPHFKVISFM